MTRCISTALAAFLALACLPPADARDGHLACAGAHLTARTQFLDIPDHDLQTLSQTITLIPAGEQIAVPLKLDVRPLRQPFLRHAVVLDARATGWACVTADDGKAYVYVMMTCTESPRRPACVNPDREWARLYDTRGRAIDAGLPREGPRVDALMKRLGLERLEAAGIPLGDPAE